MMKRHTLGLLLALGAVSGASQCFAQNAGDATRGKQIFMADACYTCHGTTGAGGGFAGPKLAHDGLSPEAILHQIREPQALMPAYSENILPAQDAADVIAYLQSLSATPAPAPATIAILNH